VLAVALETDITFPAVEQLKAYLEDPSAFVSAAPAAAAGGGEAEAPKEEEKKQEEEEEESDDDMGFGLFD
jgi:large subunit ribosomal protein LP0